jgi:hypothetical protein
MAKFMYLFRSQNAGWKPSSPEEMQQLMKAWMGWIEELKKDGHLVSTGERLNGGGTVVRGKAKTVTDGPYAEAKDTIGGYMVVEAQDLAQAVKLSHGSPIFESEGSVEIRPIVPM